MNDLTKYEQLQRKTTGQLVRLMGRELELAIRSIASRDNVVGAERAYVNASRLLPVAYPLTDEERGVLEMKVNQLRELLQARLDTSPPDGAGMEHLACALGAQRGAVCATC